MKTNTVLALLVMTLLVGFTITFFFHSFYTYYEVREVYMSLEVANKVGLNTDQEYLNFGANSPGNTCKRFMNISFPKRTTVIVGFEGPLGEWASVNEKEFILEKNETKNLEFLITIPKSAEYGNYSGNAKFFFKRI